MSRRSIILVVCGILTVLVGIAVAVITSDRSTPAAATTAPVLVATGAIADGAEGAQVVADGLVTVEQVPTGERRSGALTDPSQLEGRAFAADVAEGAQIVSADLVGEPAEVAVGSGGTAVDIPDGTEAVAVDVPFVAGGAGFAAAGDVVNVFALLDGADPAVVGSDPAAAGPATVPLLEDVVVLGVSTTGSGSSASAGANGSSAAPRTITYLLAVPQDRVPSVIQAAGFHRLYVTIPGEGVTSRPSPPAGDAEIEEGTP